MIELDMISVVVGYVGGVLLTWSLTFTLYGCDENGKQQREKEELDNFWNSPYPGNYPYNNHRVE